MVRRFFINQFPSYIKGGNIILDGQQHKHLKGALRLKVGNQVEVFDGNGQNGIAKIIEIKKNETILQLENIHNDSNGNQQIQQQQQQQHIDIENKHKIDIATSLPKKERSEWLIEKLSEIGVSNLILLETDYSKSSPQSSSLTDNKIDRFQRIIIESSKQSRNNQLLNIIPPTSLNQFLKDKFILPKENECRYSHVFLGDPNKGEELPIILDTIKKEQQQDSKSSTNTTTTRTNSTPKDILIFIGSEGGLSEKEVNIITNVVNKRSDSKLYLTGMGRNILRMESAAIIMSSIMKLFIPFLFKNNNNSINNK